MSGDWYSQLLNLNSSMQAYGSLDQERDSLARLFAKYTEQTAPPEINGTEAMNTFIINLVRLECCEAGLIRIDSQLIL